MAMLCAKITKMTEIKKQAPFKQCWVDETDFLQIGNASLASEKMPFCQYKSQEKTAEDPVSTFLHFVSINTFQDKY